MLAWLFRPRGLPVRRSILFAGAFAILAGALGVHLATGGMQGRSALDRPFHDAVVAAKPRDAWRHVAMATLDEERLPKSWSRIQLNPLYFQAAKVLLRAGASGVVVDASMTEEPPVGVPYFRCMEEGALPDTVRNMADAVVADSFLVSRIAIPLPIEDSVCARSRDMDACEANAFSAGAVLGSGWLGTRVRHADEPLDRPLWQDGTHRLMPISPQSLVGWALTGKGSFPHRSLLSCFTPYAPEGLCFQERRLPLKMSMDAFPRLSLTRLADCDTMRAIAYARSNGAAGRQILVEPLPTVESGDRFFVPEPLLGRGRTQFSGSELLAEAIETGLRGDAPLFFGEWWIAALLGFFGVGLGVWGGLRLRPGWAFLIPPFFVVLLFLAMLSGPGIFLVPVVAPALACLGGTLVAILTLVAGGAREAELTAKYIPKPIYDLVLRGGGPSKLHDRRVDVAVLMTDIRNYTTITSVLGHAESVMSLLNTYYDGIAGVALDRHSGWFEGYVGDMMCCYWPLLKGASPDEVRDQALRAAMDVRKWQQEFFRSLREGTAKVPRLSPEDIAKIAPIMGAGIGLAWGEVVMGHLGQKGGLSKFGVIGDPLNTASRIEGLTKGFDADLLATPEFVASASRCDFHVCEYACVRVKGRLDPVPLVGIDHAKPEDWNQERWNAWREAVERGDSLDPAEFGKAGKTLLAWRDKGYLKDGVWELDEK